jgi:UPF0716 family protein affecting phage T7 exclusion
VVHPSGNESIRIGSYTLPLPRSRLLRILIGVLLVIGGLFAFLPILGFWMIPLGLLVLSVDIPRVRRWRRRFAVWFHRRYPKLAAKLNLAGPGSRNGNGEAAGTDHTQASAAQTQGACEPRRLSP